MYSIHTEILLNASMNEVWRVLTDFENYSEWNPFFTQIQKKDDKLRLKVKLTQGFHYFYRARLIEWTPPVSMIWHSHLGFIPGLLSGVHYYRLTKVSENSTKFEQGETVYGLFAGLSWKWLAPEIRQDFEVMNNALIEKMYAEKELGKVVNIS